MWAPSASRLAFARHGWIDEEQQTGTFVYDAPTEKLRRITRRDHTVLAWIDRNTLLVEEAGDAHAAIGHLNLNSGALHRTMSLQEFEFARQALDIAPSPDGERFAIEWQRPSATTDPLDYRNEVWLVTGPGKARMVSLASEKFAGDAAWSPSGRDLAYSTGETLYVVPADVMSRRRVAGGRHSDAVRDLVFSPDGRKLAYANTGSGFTGDVYLLDLASGRTRQLTHLAESEEGVFGWSPDSRRLLVSTGQDGGVLIVSAADGTVLKRLPEFGGAWPGTGSYCASFSHDASMVAFVRSWPGSFGFSSDAAYIAPSTLDTAEPLRP